MKHGCNQKLALVLDSSVIIELVSLGLSKKLTYYKKAKAAEIIVPITVRNELNRQNNDQEIQETLTIGIQQGLFKVMNPPEETMTELKFRHPSLGDGEIGVLALALTLKKQSFKSVTPLLDDAKARKAARNLKFRVHGTLWLLIELKKNSIIRKEIVRKIITELPDHGFYLSNEKMAEVINEVERHC